MEQLMLNKTAVSGARETEFRLSLAHSDSNVLLARIFLLVILGTGILSLLSGTSPEDIHLCPCPFYMLTHVQCPGCGMTRACIAITRGDIRPAWNYHPFAFGLMFLAIGFALAPNHMRRGWQRIPCSARNSLIWGLLVLVIGFWAYRLTLWS
jgi:hypothetical protein